MRPVVTVDVTVTDIRYHPLAKAVIVADAPVKVAEEAPADIIPPWMSNVARPYLAASVLSDISSVTYLREFVDGSLTWTDKVYSAAVMVTS